MLTVKAVTYTCKQKKEDTKDTSDYSKPQEKAGKAQTKQTYSDTTSTMCVWLSLLMDVGVVMKTSDFILAR